MRYNEGKRSFPLPKRSEAEFGFPESEAFRYPNGAGHPVDVRLARTGVERRREAGQSTRLEST